MPLVRDLLQVLVLVAGGAAMGLGANALSPRPVPLGRPVFAASSSGTAECTGGDGEEPAAASRSPHPRISQADAVAACGACTASFVDARGAAAFAAGHVPGAIHLPPH